jgi:hypothetical protein
LISWYYIFTTVIPSGENVKGEGGEDVGGWRSGPAGLEVGGKEKIIANFGLRIANLKERGRRAPGFVKRLRRGKRESGLSFCLFLSHEKDVFDECFGLRDPATNLRCFEAYEIHIVALLTPFKEVIVSPSQILRNFPGFHVMSIKKTTHASVLRR